MNKVILTGRLTKEPDIRNANETIVARYSLAVDRFGDGTDFINCVSFGKTAEHTRNFLHKGTKIIAEGRIQTGSYTDKNGSKIYTTDVIVERTEFCESKSTQKQNDFSGDDAFMPSDSLDGDELPWN